MSECPGITEREAAFFPPAMLVNTSRVYVCTPLQTAPDSPPTKIIEMLICPKHGEDDFILKNHRLFGQIWREGLELRNADFQRVPAKRRKGSRPCSWSASLSR